MYSSIAWQSHLLYWSNEKVFPCYQVISVLKKFSMRWLQRKRSVGISKHNGLLWTTNLSYSLLAMPSLLPANVFPCLVINVYQWLMHTHGSIACKLSSARLSCPRAHRCWQAYTSSSFALPTRHSMEAIAKFDFSASGEDELSFQAGDMLKVSAAPGLSTKHFWKCCHIFLCSHLPWQNRWRKASINCDTNAGSSSASTNNFQIT